MQRQATYNNRLQLSGYTDALSGTPLLTAGLGYGTTTNSGTLASAAYTNAGLTFTQTYGYDGLNRLGTASDTGGWAQSYGYDAYGNMWLASASGLPANGAMPTTNVYNGKNQNPNVSYDAAGNQTVLGAVTLTYDAENRQMGAANTVGGGSAAYQYDGLGQRVAKTLAAGTTI